VVFAPGQAIESSLKQLAERRTDIFGVGQFLSSVVFFTYRYSVVSNTVFRSYEPSF
jgi:hypothetical protein